MLASLILVLTLWLLTGCGGGGGDHQKEEQQPAEEEPISGRFVGEAPNADALVALVAEEPQGGSEREVKAYLCDGEKLSEWFQGEAGNEVALTSDNGARLQGTLASEEASGTVSVDRVVGVRRDLGAIPALAQVRGPYTLTRALAGRPGDDATDVRGPTTQPANTVRDTFTFKASLATGATGLYNVSVSYDGSFSGNSEAGWRIHGHIDPQPNPNGEHPTSGTIISPDGQEVSLNADAITARQPSPGPARFIVSTDRIVGAASDRRAFTVKSVGSTGLETS